MASRLSVRRPAVLLLAILHAAAPAKPNYSYQVTVAEPGVSKTTSETRLLSHTHGSYSVEEAGSKNVHFSYNVNSIDTQPILSAGAPVFSQPHTIHHPLPIHHIHNQPVHHVQPQPVKVFQPIQVQQPVKVIHQQPVFVHQPQPVKVFQPQPVRVFQPRPPVYVQNPIRIDSGVVAVPQQPVLAAPIGPIHVGQIQRQPAPTYLPPVTTTAESSSGGYSYPKPEQPLEYPKPVEESQGGYDYKPAPAPEQPSGGYDSPRPPTPEQPSGGYDYKPAPAAEQPSGGYSYPKPEKQLALPVSAPVIQQFHQAPVKVFQAQKVVHTAAISPVQISAPVQIAAPVHIAAPLKIAPAISTSTFVRHPNQDAFRPQAVVSRPVISTVGVSHVAPPVKVFHQPQQQFFVQQRPFLQNPQLPIQTFGPGPIIQSAPAPVIQSIAPQVAPIPLTPNGGPVKIGAVSGGFSHPVVFSFGYDTGAAKVSHTYAGSGWH